MRVKSFEDACLFLKYNPDTILPEVSKFPEKYQKAIISFCKLVIITEAINDSHQFNWNDRNEKKWYPWFYLNEPGFRFCDAGFDYSLTYSAGGSRLCFRTKEDAIYAAKTFLEYFRDIMVVS